MYKFIVINTASDGRHFSVHGTLERAQKAVFDIVDGPDAKFALGRTYYSDWGNRVTIETRPDNWTVKLEERLADAFDARECGTATSAQLSLLDKHLF